MNNDFINCYEFTKYVQSYYLRQLIKSLITFEFKKLNTNNYFMRD